MSARSLLVTGGAGFLGSHICDHFVGLGWQVSCLDNFSSGRRSNIATAGRGKAFSLIKADVREPVAGAPDLIFNLASAASPADYQRDPIGTAMTNALGAFNVLERARLCGARVLQASTSEIYGDPDQTPQSEDYMGRANPIGVRACYNEGKRFAETLCADFRRRHGVEASIFRIFNVYGPRMREDDGRVISNFIASALRGRPLRIYGDGRQTRSFCFVSDLVAAFDAFARQDASPAKPLNIGNPQEIEVGALAEMIVEMVGSKSAIERVEAAPEDPRRRCPDIRAAAETLGWRPAVPLVDGLRLTIAYFESELASGVAADGP